MKNKLFLGLLVLLVIPFVNAGIWGDCNENGVIEIPDLFCQTNQIDSDIINLIIQGNVKDYDNTFECDYTKKCQDELITCDGNGVIEIPDLIMASSGQCNNITTYTRILCEADFICNSYYLCNSKIQLEQGIFILKIWIHLAMVL